MDGVSLTLVLGAIFCFLKSTEGQFSSDSFMPTRPVMSPRLCDTRHLVHGRMIQFISDQQTKCMYWVCTAGRPIPKQCGLQTYISEFYEGDEYNPCTETYKDTTRQFDCTRKGFDPDGNPVCKKLYEDNHTCKNAGQVISQGNLCWCECAAGFTGFECTKRATDTSSTSNGRPAANPSANGNPSPGPSPTTGAGDTSNGSPSNGNPRNGNPRNRDTGNGNPGTRDTGNGNPGTRDTGNGDTPSDNLIESAEDQDGPPPDSTISSLKRRQRKKRKRLILARFQNTVNDVDNTGPLIPDKPPFSKTITLDDGTENAANGAGKAARASAPPGVEFAEGDNTGGSSRRRDPVSLPVVPPVDADGRFSLGDPCPRGFQADFCKLQDGCLNGGTCVNQCLGASCLCRPPFTAGRRCEQYHCTDNVECMNGGTCSRGLSGRNPVATCECVGGFTGPMCEISP